MASELWSVIEASLYARRHEPIFLQDSVVLTGNDLLDYSEESPSGALCISSPRKVNQVVEILTGLRHEKPIFLDKSCPRGLNSDPAMEQLQETLSNRNLVIASTSGSVGTPKLAILTHDSILADIEGILSMGVFERGLTHLNVLPFSHLFGLVGDLLIPILFKCKVQLCESASTFLFEASRSGANVFNIPPALAGPLQKTLNSFKGASRSCKIICGGAPVADTHARSFNDSGHSFHVAYGLTECSPCVSIDPFGKGHYGTVGYPIKNVDLAINNEEILVRGPVLFSGYIQNGYLQTDITDSDGWFHTGDLGVLREDGSLSVFGRKDNILIFQDGSSLSPEILEKRIEATCSVEECVVSQTQEGRLLILYSSENDDCEPEQICSEVLRFVPKEFSMGVKAEKHAIESLRNPNGLRKKVRKNGNHNIPDNRSSSM